jgi:hypothetical protein
VAGIKAAVEDAIGIAGQGYMVVDLLSLPATVLPFGLYLASLDTSASRAN